jgi:outer membrane protein OmpA-like peptidoglycan-associated protein
VILSAFLAVAALPAFAAQPELKMVMADPRLPNKPTTHILDDRVSTGRIENFRELYVNPAQIGESLKPVGKLGPVGKMLSPANKRASIPVVNETSSYAEISINGVKIGVIDALQNGAIHDVPHGLYEITFGLQNGYEETRTIHTLHLDAAIIPGGKDVQPALESGYVPSWHATPNQGYVVLEPPAPEAPAKPRVRIEGERVKIDEKVMFALNSAEIDAVSHSLLDELAGVLSANPEVELIQIQGHTDARGPAGANQKLSTSRAGAVKKYLVEAGISEDRMQSVGYGSARPLVEGDTEEAYEANRRVEIHILKQRPKVVFEGASEDAPDGSGEPQGN